MKQSILAASIFAVATINAPAMASDWEKFFTAIPQDGTIDATSKPEVLPSSGDVDKDVEAMFRRGFVPVGYTSFNASNDKTKDGERLAAKLHARYLIVSTKLASSESAVLPLTLPNTTTSYTNGTASAYGSGGYAHGTYSGTTTTYGTQTTFIPYTINRFDKTAIYFKEIPRKGAGLKIRDLTNHEMAAIGTRHAFFVQFVRDGSPAYDADIFPGDVITQVNDDPVDAPHWRSAINGPQPMRVHVIRNGVPKNVVMTIPPEWQGLP